MRLVISFLSIILLFLILFSLWGFFNALRPTKLHSVIIPTDLLIPYEKVSFHTEDNILLHGWFIPNDDPHAKTIILLHGYPADKGNILSAMAFLHKQFNLLLFDFRYLGESEGSHSTIGVNEVLDLKAAIIYLHTRGIDTVGVWGFSLGGAVAIMTAPDTPQIRAIVAQSPYARLDWMVADYYQIPFLRYPLTTLTRLWGLLFLHIDLTAISPAKSAERLQIPILIISTNEDVLVSAEHTIAFQEALRHNPSANFIFGPGTHGQFIENNEQVVTDFFQTNLP